jgi:hypothetical protein
MLGVPFWTISHKRKTLGNLFRTIKKKKKLLVTHSKPFKDKENNRFTFKKNFAEFCYVPFGTHGILRKEHFFLGITKNVPSLFRGIFFRKGNFMATLIQSSPSLQCTVFTILKSAVHFGLVFTSPWTLKRTGQPSFQKLFSTKVETVFVDQLFIESRRPALH